MTETTPPAVVTQSKEKYAEVHYDTDGNIRFVRDSKTLIKSDVSVTLEDWA